MKEVQDYQVQLQNEIAVWQTKRQTELQQYAFFCQTTTYTLA